MNRNYYDQIMDYLSSGGAVMFPLVLLGAVLWFAIGYRVFTLRRGSTRSVRALIDRARSGRPPEPRGIIPRAIHTALAELLPGVPDIRNRLDCALSAFDVEMDRFSITICGVVAVAPLLGLLGTVTGMIETFDSLGDMTLYSQSGGIAGGISLALFTTQMGLAVAIPGLLIGRMLDQRSRSLAIEIQKIKDIVASMNANGEF
jgi:biopolymer transport protein ExbB